MSLAVGIDLGTTNSCVALYRNGEVEIIETIDEQSTTPSFVYYDDNGSIVVGDDAVKRSAIKPQNGVFDAKRFIGRKFDDPMVQEDMKKLPFAIVKSPTHDGFMVEVAQGGRKRQVRPEEISAEVLKKLRSDVKRQLGSEVTNAVITVPAYFTSSQKGATRAAAKLAGFNVLKLINEPTAAALAFVQDKDNQNPKRTILVYDLGGGTFDVSLVEFQNGEGTVKCTNGDSHLGGRDFDNALMDYFMGEIKKMYGKQGLMISTKDQDHRVALRRLRLKCEAIKKELSEAQKATLSIEQFYGVDVELTVTRQQFENLNDASFKRTLDIVQKVLDEGGVNKDQVDDVVLVGGSTKIPKIQQMTKEFFLGKVLNKSVNPDEAVAFGAAIQAALSNDSPLQDSDATPLVDVTSLSLGIEVIGEIMSNIIERSTKIPTKNTQTYFTVSDLQTTIAVRVYEGESKNVKDNYLLGVFKIEGLPPLPAGQAKIDVTMELDESGLLHVTAEDLSNQSNKRKLNIELPNDRLTDEQIDDMIRRFGKI